jgi:hypothetical protein
MIGITFIVVGHLFRVLGLIMLSHIDGYEAAAVWNRLDVLFDMRMDWRSLIRN